MLLENGNVYASAILTSPLHRVNSVLQRGTNMTKWSVFPGMVTYNQGSIILFSIKCMLRTVVVNKIPCMTVRNQNRTDQRIVL